ncbi:MAG: hypothetical protein H8F28_15935 [Fibrella sp.]|nr:hypothetical protein [Armatimonadota bacterium]
MTPPFVIIDIFAQAFRAYFALRTPMHSPTTGEPRNAVYGFTAMLFKLMHTVNPGAVVGALDLPGPTFRDVLYPRYKAERAPDPPELIAQIPRICEVMDCFGIPALSEAGYEADDVIAGVVARVTGSGSAAPPIRIISPDKDLWQLLSGTVTLYDVHKEVTLDVNALWQTKGIRPDQAVDYLTLVGDRVDNIEGVAGIGPRTAVALLEMYGDIEGIYKNLEAIPVARRTSLAAARESLALAQQLIRLRQPPGVMRDFDTEVTTTQPINADRAVALFQTLGFNRFQDQARELATIS